MKIAESVSECKESTKESQGEVFRETMGFCRKTMTISKDYRRQSRTMRRLWKTMEDNPQSSKTMVRQWMIMEDND